MRTTLIAALSASVCALSACGGGSDNPSPAQASIAACYAAPDKDIHFALDTGVVVGKAYQEAKIAQDTFNGKDVTAQTLYVNFAQAPWITTRGTLTTYWTVTDDGVDFLGRTEYVKSTDGASSTEITTIVTRTSAPIPLNMQPGQSIDQQYTENGSQRTVLSDGINPADQNWQTTYSIRTTFIGFEKITLAGKTFSDVCHFQFGSTEEWVAPGYGTIKMINSEHPYGPDDFIWQFGTGSVVEPGRPNS